jgi:DNA-binding Lrp family transcriptional regulator
MQEIIDYCFKPRTMNDLCARFKMSDRAMQARMRKLTRENLIIRRETDVGTRNWRQWYISQKPSDVVRLCKEYSRNVLGVWL